MVKYNVIISNGVIRFLLKNINKQINNGQMMKNISKVLKYLARL